MYHFWWLYPLHGLIGVGRLIMNVGPRMGHSLPYPLILRQHVILILTFYFFIKVFVYLFLRERDRVRMGEGQRERRGEKIPSRPCTASAEPDVGLQATHRETMA